MNQQYTRSPFFIRCSRSHAIDFCACVKGLNETVVRIDFCACVKGLNETVVRISHWYCLKLYASQLTSTNGEPRPIVYNVDQQQSYLRDHPGQLSSQCCVTFLYYQILRKQNTEPNAHPYVYFTTKPLPSPFTRILDMQWCC